MNPIYQEILDARNGHYIHVLEVSNVYELESICESLFNEYIDKYSIAVLIDICSTLKIYYFDDENENEILRSLGSRPCAHQRPGAFGM